MNCLRTSGKIALKTAASVTFFLTVQEKQSCRPKEEEFKKIEISATSRKMSMIYVFWGFLIVLFLILQRMFPSGLPMSAKVQAKEMDTIYLKLKKQWSMLFKSSCPTTLKGFLGVVTLTFSLTNWELMGKAAAIYSRWQFTMERKNLKLQTSSCKYRSFIPVNFCIIIALKGPS